MTNAMKKLLEDLCGFVKGNVCSGQKSYSLLINSADLAAAKALEAIGVVRIDHEPQGCAKAYLAATTARPTVRGAVEALFEALHVLERLRELTPARANEQTAEGYHGAVRAIVETALDRLTPALNPPVTVAATDSRITKDWCLNMARLEDGQEIGAGMPDHPLRAPEVAATDQAAEVERVEAECARLLAAYLTKEIGRIMHQAEHWAANGKPLAVHHRLMKADDYYQILCLMTRDPNKGWKLPFDEIRDDLNRKDIHAPGAYPPSRALYRYRDPAFVAAALAPPATDQAGHDPMQHGMTAKTEVDRLAILLFEAFAKAEPREGITRYPASYWATFADMARAIIADRDVPATDQAAEVEAWLVEHDFIEPAAEGFPAYCNAIQPADLIEIAQHFATQPATGRTMGGEDGLRKTLEDIETMLTPNGNVWTGTEPKWQTDAYARARAALQNGGE